MSDFSKPWISGDDENPYRPGALACPMQRARPSAQHHVTESPRGKWCSCGAAESTEALAELVTTLYGKRSKRRKRERR